MAGVQWPGERGFIVGPTMDHGLFNGSCLRYLSIAARIVRREVLKSFPSFCFTAA